MASKKTATYDVENVTVLAYNDMTKEVKTFVVEVPEIVGKKERQGFIDTHLDSGFISVREMSVEKHTVTRAMASKFFWDNSEIIMRDGVKVSKDTEPEKVEG